ncbi:MAG: cobalt-precorrin-5B (C(1))-methyltransferase [Opitutaceae bacterium]|nr:cobalt-precorrin-5B (C(1))-methyltransferase [Cytophagales bacterium]
MSELQDIPDGPLRIGYTTGACATACAKAALLALISQKEIYSVEVMLPIGEKVLFKILSCELNENEAWATTEKDAGDDPDVTHGAIIGAQVRLNESGKIIFYKGVGVGLVTLPGLEIAVGEPAINPVPRQMMESACKKILADAGLDRKGVEITVFVPEGERIAKRTLNERLGIMGGISILGTTGIVTPFSASSYIASIRQGIDVALANGSKEIVINSGAKSEKYLQGLFDSLPDFAFIHYGNWIGETLQKIAESEIRTVNLGIMLGKCVKLAEGNLDTHSNKNSWNKEFVSDLAKAAGYSTEILQSVLELNMAGRLTELFPFQESEAFYIELLNRCYVVCSKILPKCELNIYLINRDGAYIKYKP